MPLQISESENRTGRVKSELVKEKSVVERVKEGNRQQEIDLERLSKDLSMAKVHQMSILDELYNYTVVCLTKITSMEL